jgi:hypothetical protein
MLIANHTFSCDGVERVGTVEGYRRDRAGYFDGDCAGHSDGSTFKLQAHWRSLGQGRLGSVCSDDRLIDHASRLNRRASCPVPSRSS